MPNINLPDETASGDLITGTNRSRLALSMRAPSRPEEPVTFGSSAATMSRYRGVGNPYGRGLDAYEPNNVIFDDYATAYDAVQSSKQDEALQQAIDTASTTNITFGGGTQPVEGTGKVKNMLNAALDLARRGVPYVWGGTTANGVDCSGLIYYAARTAGLDLKRYRAVDYGHMGQAVTLDQARPGDLVYYDNPGTDTDHVGIYIGNGQVVQAPQTGDHVRVTSVGKATSIRRIFDDAAFGTIATPSGGTAVSYGGSRYDPVVGTGNAGLLGRGGLTAGALGSTITRRPSYSGGLKRPSAY